MGKSYRKWLFRIGSNQMIGDNDNALESAETFGVSLKEASESIKRLSIILSSSTGKVKKGGK